MTHPAAAGGAAHVFVADLAAPVLDDEDRHHLGRVLRLRAGELVTASDGAGSWRRCRWVDGAIEPDGEVELDPRPEPALTVGFGLTKGDKPELVVQKLTELGIDRIVPVVAERSVVRWEPDKAAKAVRRLAQVARGAAMQSRRPWLPVVASPRRAADLVREAGATAVLAEPGGAPLTLAATTVLVGPEGGWSEAERRLAPAVGLGPTVLRAETAAVAAGALVAALRAGLVLPNSHGEW